MYNSGITVEELIEDLKSEVDVAIEIPDKTYVLWLNSLEQLLYSEVIKEQISVEGRYLGNGVVEFPELDFSNLSNQYDYLRFEDIYTVFVGDTQLKKTTLTSGVIFPNCYYKLGESTLGVSAQSGNIKVVFFVRPKLKAPENLDNQYVMLPVEFIDLAKAKLRGEAYKLANEDSLAAKWLNDYNVLLENFKAWIADKSPNFGL